MLLSRDAIAAAVRAAERRRLLQAGPRPHLRRHHHAQRRGRAGRPGHRGRRAAPGRPARGHRRPGHAGQPAGRHAGHVQRRPLRQDHRGARPAPPAHPGGRRDRRDGLRPARRRHQDRRPGRVHGVRRRPAAHHRLDGRDPQPARRQPRPARAALRAGRVDHRHADRLHRPRRAARRACSPTPCSCSAPARRPARRRSPSAWPPTPRSRPTGRCSCSPRDEQARAHPAHAVLRGPGRLQAGAQRQPHRGRLAEDRPRHRPPGRGPDLDRRQPEPHDHGDPLQGPAAQGPHRRPRPGRRRLPPADDRPLVGREPPGRGVRDQPWPQDPGPRARVPGAGPVAAVPWPRDAPGQAADAGRPARVGLPHRRHPHHPGRHRRRGHPRRAAGVGRAARPDLDAQRELPPGAGAR